eukprot:gnl/MRDRNA2_/MRDRNA2_34078_c0_seq1.p1 gnl/MRDRNA2_/MRDRNA2_34078_c0~~gnl/MRDRNA2_/MRDRNA2_34078_c0_seq1.p1  ORF type:complete len:249 (+),score=58.64 gnl/MRDRNA2_/MRDRNA2_34078_c0_seq1:127-873(+)
MAREWKKVNKLWRTGTAWSADQPFLEPGMIERWKLRWRFWPPRDASPPKPIEPWGKQFIVYNARQDVEVHLDPRAPTLEDIRPRWMQDDIVASMLSPGDRMKVFTNPERMTPADADDPRNQKETMLCITDFRQRPLLYLSPNEWAEFVAALPALRSELKKYREKLEDMGIEEEITQREKDLRLNVVDKYREKRIGHGGQQGRGKRAEKGWPGYIKGPIPPRALARRTPLAKTTLSQASRELLDEGDGY